MSSWTLKARNNSSLRHLRIPRDAGPPGVGAGVGGGTLEVVGDAGEFATGVDERRSFPRANIEFFGIDEVEVGALRIRADIRAFGEGGAVVVGRDGLRGIVAGFAVCILAVEEGPLFAPVSCGSLCLRRSLYASDTLTPAAAGILGERISLVKGVRFPVNTSCPGRLRNSKMVIYTSSTTAAVASIKRTRASPATEWCS